MDVSPERFSGQNGAPEFAPTAEFLLRPTSAYGTLGPGSDISPESLKGGLNPGLDSGARPTMDRPSPARPPRRVWIATALSGILFAVAVNSILLSRFAQRRLTGQGSLPVKTLQNSHDLSQIDRLKPQKQAETLLEMAVGHSDGAVQQISSRADRWRGRVQWTAQISNLSTAALNSDDLQVRASGIEVELAAYGVTKDSAGLDYVLRSADSSDHAQKVWALWALGLLGNRGVGTEQVVQVLTEHLQDKNEDVESRRWAVEALAIVGSTPTIPVLLEAMHNDPSPAIRERAACGLAEAGMFTHEQRMSAVPQLLNYADDPALDAKTHGWAFQALHDITHQHLPNDAAAWRNWYESGQPN
jgi:hypothetical protein